ncbi:MAG: hypothetical protein ABI778_10840, partial [Ignavibacteriota bacterium]
MSILSKIACTFVCICVICLFATGELFGQGLSEDKIAVALSKVSARTIEEYRVVSVGVNHSPSIIVPSPSIEHPQLNAADRLDQETVAKFAGSEATKVAKTVLALPTEARLVTVNTSRSQDLWLSLFKVSYSGIPVRERDLRVNIGALSGKVMLIRNNIPAKSPASMEPLLSTENIFGQTRDILGSHAQITGGPNLVYVDEIGNPKLRLSYEVTVKDPDMNDLWRLTFDAQTGDLIEKKSLILHASSGFSTSTERSRENLKLQVTQSPETPEYSPLSNNSPMNVSGKVRAKIHLHSPFDTLTTVGLPYAKLTVNGISVMTDSLGNWSLINTNFPLVITGKLEGKYFTTGRQDGGIAAKINGTTSDLLWDDSNSDAAERDAYYSSSYAYLNAHRLDPKILTLEAPMEVNVNIASTCNAYYSPDALSINFFAEGMGCSNTAQISDVVFHEYGHHLVHAVYEQMTGTTDNLVDGSLGEGFADLNSAFIRDDPKIGIGFFGNNTKTLRTCSNTKKWPKNISGDVHANGQIISGAFWDLRKSVGHDVAERLFHYMLRQMPDGIGGTDSASLGDAFTSTLLATILTDDDDNYLGNGTPHLTQILAAFALHNITLTKFLDLDVDQVADQDTTASAYVVTATAGYTGLVGSLDERSIKVYYSAAGSAYTPIEMFPLSNHRYSGSIPKVAPGSIVKYYAVAGSTISASDTITSPSPASPKSFLVGYRRVYIDDAEKDNGWKLGSTADAATTGMWVRGKPHGTYSDPTPPIFYVQQDTDHSPAPGITCFVTGNQVDPSGASDPNFIGFDDVDNGETTLTSPIYDLSNSQQPILRYWYYFSNDQGQNPGVPKFQVDISNDSGRSWKSVQNSNKATSGWKQF